MTQIVKVAEMDMVINHDVWPDWTLATIPKLLPHISSIMHQFKEIPLLESLLNFPKDIFYQF